MKYKRLSNVISVYMLDVDNMVEMGSSARDPACIDWNPSRQSVAYSSYELDRLPLLRKCTFKWIVIWSLCALVFLNSLVSRLQELVIAPFSNPDDTSIFVQPRYTYKSKANKHIEMLIVVTSIADSYKQRQLIRKTWAKTDNQRPSTKVLFLVGIPKSTEVLKAESTLYHDLILTSIEENYYNLPLKTLTMLGFTDKYYSQVECLVKVDSDNYVNVSNLEDFCDSLKGQELITGYCEDNSEVVRSFMSKWQIPKFVYASSTYPLYCFGETYMFVGRQTRAKLLSKLGEYGFESSKNRRLMPEDVIFSGFLADLANIERRSTPGFALQKPEVKFDCLNGRARAYSFHLIDDEDNFPKAIHHMSKADQTECSNMSLETNNHTFQ